MRIQVVLSVVLFHLFTKLCQCTFSLYIPKHVHIHQVIPQELTHHYDRYPYNDDDYYLPDDEIVYEEIIVNDPEEPEIITTVTDKIATTSVTSISENITTSTSPPSSSSPTITTSITTTENTTEIPKETEHITELYYENQMENNQQYKFKPLNYFTEESENYYEVQVKQYLTEKPIPYNDEYLKLWSQN